jgi:outer membrane lipoprotein-sorting protein
VPPVDAYVLPGSQVLDLMLDNFGRAQRIMVSQRLVFYQTDLRDNFFECSETLRYIFPETFRSDILSETAQKIHVVSEGESLTVLDGKILPDAETVFDCYKDILLYRSRELLQRRLFILGVDVSIASLGRFQEKIAYVLGAQYPDESVSQLWIDKGTFRPIRWIIVQKSGAGHNNILELQYADWRQTEKTWYPMRIEFYQNHKLMREIKVDDILAEPFFQESLFDIEALKGIYFTDDSTGEDKGVSKEPSEVQQKIDEFKKLYE